MPHVYDGKERPDSGPFRRPDDYSVTVWLTRRPMQLRMEKCIGYLEGSLDTREKAAQYCLSQAIRQGRLSPGDDYEVDVSEDASDEWFTVLVGTVPPKEEPQ